ncbi:MAG: LysR family transcriptional regulator [Hyphomonadaceae bacterium]
MQPIEASSVEHRLPASSWPTLRQLQFLVALDAHGSFVAAAEAVGVTQPTLSAGIKELRRSWASSWRNGAVRGPC